MKSKSFASLSTGKLILSSSAAFPMGRAHYPRDRAFNTKNRCWLPRPYPSHPRCRQLRGCARRVRPVDFFDMRVITLDLPALIESKRAVRRPKDLAALPHIEAVLRTREATESTED